MPLFQQALEKPEKIKLKTGKILYIMKFVYLFARKNLEGPQKNWKYNGESKPDSSITKISYSTGECTGVKMRLAVTCLPMKNTNHDFWETSMSTKNKTIFFNSILK